MKASKEVTDAAPLFLNFETRWKSALKHTQIELHIQGNNMHYPSKIRLLLGNEQEIIPFDLMSSTVQSFYALIIYIYVCM